MYDIAQRLVIRVRDPHPVGDVTAAVSEVRRRIAAMVRMKLESELASIATARLEGKKLRVAMRHLGWLGDVPLTLQATGDEFGITRERVRQISSPVVELLRRGRTFLPRLEEAIRFVARSVPGDAEEIELGLQTAGITRSLFRAESIINTATLIGRPITFTVDQSRSPRLVVDHDNVLLQQSILKAATGIVSKYGLCNINDLSERMSETARARIEDKLILSILRRSGSYVDLGQGWFWLSNLPRNHLCTVIRKMLALAPRMHVSEIRAGLASDPRGPGFAPPKSAVLAFCQSALGCVIDEQDFVRTVAMNLPLDVLSETEMVLFDVLQQYGPLLHRIEFEKLCIQHGVNPVTFSLYLTRSPIVARYAPSIYGLRGAVFTPGDIDRLTIPRATERFADHGWTDTAQPWIALEVTSSMLSTGITHVPAGFNEIVIGRYVLKTDEGTEVGKLVVSERAAWGLSPLFRRYGGEVGDVLVLTFDVCKHEVTARIGEKKAVLPEVVWSVEEVEHQQQA